MELIYEKSRSGRRAGHVPRYDVPKAEVPAEVWEAAEKATQESSLAVTGTVREEKRVVIVVAAVAMVQRAAQRGRDRPRPRAAHARGPRDGSAAPPSW